ncbi:hypothetical protein DERF_002743 [Dermatophagoides farinae]|uniref:Uncharacterized protein n=1 Tax=Dermatophagoides farinae TaxID=6954 RepID=A0A922IDQ9_DERFA|nr:hypothetical protein DERF_002743 [Dermatophagoides farinae]
MTKIQKCPSYIKAHHHFENEEEKTDVQTHHHHHHNEMNKYTVKLQLNPQFGLLFFAFITIKLPKNR